MAYFLIEDFSAGLDLRKSSVTSRPGTLRVLRNAVINPGGEIEKRKMLTPIASLPAGYTHGLGFNQGQLQVLGHTAAVGVPTLPTYVNYIPLTVTDAETVEHVVDVQVFGPGFYTVCLFTDDSYRHYYDGTLVPDSEVQGTNVRAHKSKLYSIDGQNLRFSAIKDPTDWTGGTGYGIIDVTTEDQGLGDLVGIEQYYSYLALFGRTSIQLWAMDPDPALNTIQQVLGNIGLVAPNGVARYANGDVLFLSHTGIRSLRARDSSNAAVLNDIGSPIDSLVREKRNAMVPADADFINGIVDPLTGQFWLIWKDEAFVLSLYPNSKVSAWSTLRFPFNIDYVTVANSRIAFRSGEDVYLYGAVAQQDNPFDPNVPAGDVAFDYDNSEVEVTTHFIDAGKPATRKRWTGIDIACTGEWTVEVCPDFGNPDVWTTVATVDTTTFDRGRVPIDVEGTHLALRFKSNSFGPATLSALAIHFDDGEAS